MNRSYRLAKLMLLALLLTPQIAGVTRTPATKPALELKPCEVKGIPGSAKCGALEVFENRATRKGRTIKINVLVLPATGQKREPDPFVYLAGGPGSAATEEAAGVAQIFAGLREHRDLLFVDQRGTGQSNPLNCDFYNPADAQSYLEYFFPIEDLRKCREQLEPKADLTLYTTNIAADDMDDVREALGYEQLNLYGGSYGTRAAMVYMRRHPKHVRSAILHGVAPVNQFMPRNFPQDTERALQGVLAECAADEACKTAFPEANTDAARVLEALLQSPAEAEVKLPGSNTAVRVKLNRNLVAEAVRYMLYSPMPASRIPLFLHLAAHGNYGPLADAALRYRKFLVGTGSNGMYLSVTCAEDMPSIKEEEAKEIARNTFLGAYRFHQQKQACELWPRASIDSHYADPVRSDAPVLIFSGEWDPVTPPSNGDAAAKTLPNSLHIVVPHGGHGFGGLENIDCIDRLAIEFVERGTAKGLDTSCVKTIRRKGFAVKL
jgi:pimeloyl-ACP methyl ester carboxylesterase